MGKQYDWMHDPKYALFDDLNQIDEITTPEQIHELLGDPIILERYVNNYDYLFNRIVGIGELCWGNVDPNTGEKLQKTMIRLKRGIDDNDTTDVRVLPMNRLIMSLTFLRPIIMYLEYINLDEFLLDTHMSEKRRNNVQDKIVSVLQKFGTPIVEIQEKMSRLSLDWKMLMLDFAEADMQIYTAENLFLNHYRAKQSVPKPISTTSKSNG